MKSIFLALIITSFTNQVFSQETNKELELKNKMKDSLWTSLYDFCKVAETYLNKNKVTQSDVSQFLKYVFEHMEDSLQSTDFVIPYKVTKEQALTLLIEQTKDMIGNECTYTFESWDGWDGKTSCTGFGFDIHHNGYKDQFLVIINTKNKLHCIFSVNSTL